MRIQIKMLTGKMIQLDVDPTDTIFRVKQKVEEKSGVPPEQQRLIFAGRQLRDDQQLCPGATSESGEKEGGEQTAGSGDGAPASATVPADKNAMPQIVAGSVLHLVLALRGGAYS